MSLRNVPLVLCLIAAGCAVGPLGHRLSSARQASHERRTLTVDGRQRTYWMHWPRGDDGSRPLPLVLLLHGHGGTARRAERISSMSAQADRAGFAVAYPEGASWLNMPWRSWNAGACCGYAAERRVDDVRFLEALLDELARTHRVDARRVYVAGMSNGGMMAYRLACELSGRVAAVGVVAGALSVEACRPEHPVAVLAVHGTADQHVLYQGGRSPRSGYRRFDPPLQETVAFWVAHNRCAPELRTEQQGPARLDTYTGCADGAGVSVATLLDGGHAWPAAGWQATPNLWAFFSRHAKPE